MPLQRRCFLLLLVAAVLVLVLLAFVVNVPRTSARHQLLASSSTPVASANTSIQVKVIIVTYMRSGSSFTGDLFNHHPQAFYVYEPLWSLKRMSNRGQSVFFFDRPPSRLMPERWLQSSSVAGSTLKAFLGCDFYALDPHTLGQYHMRHSQSTQGYYNCQKQHAGLLRKLDCLPLLFEACRHSNVTAVKTIRFSMAQAARLMTSDPLIKVVHLLRDPRPTLLSQMRVGEFKPVALNQTFRTFCQRVLDDLRQAERMRARFPGRVLSIRYEDLAAEPLRFTQKLLGFGGLPMGEELGRYVWNITSAGLPDSCAICSTRSNSSRTASKWRGNVSLGFVRAVDENCGRVARRLGYLPFTTMERLTDLSVPAFVEYGEVPGLWI